MEFKRETVTYVDAVLYNGDNEKEVLELFLDEDGNTAQYSKMSGKVKEEDVAIMVIFYKDKKGKEKKLTVSNGKYVVKTSRSVSVQDQDKFEDKYDRV